MLYSLLLGKRIQAIVTYVADDGWPESIARTVQKPETVKANENTHGAV
jgi:predicted neuraminidase